MRGPDSDGFCFSKDAEKAGLFIPSCATLRFLRHNAKAQRRKVRRNTPTFFAYAWGLLPSTGHVYGARKYMISIASRSVAEIAPTDAGIASVKRERITRIVISAPNAFTAAGIRTRNVT